MKTFDNHKRLTPLQELRLEKAILKEQCSEKEQHIGSSFSYIYNNITSLTISTIGGSIGRKVGLIQPKKQSYSPLARIKNDLNLSSSTTIRETVLNGLKLTYPIIKPIVYSFVISKIKGVFGLKRKRK